MSAAEPEAFTGVVSAGTAERGVSVVAVPVDDPPVPVPEALSAAPDEMLEDGVAEEFVDNVDAEVVDGFEAADSHDGRIAIRRSAVNRML